MIIFSFKKGLVKSFAKLADIQETMSKEENKKVKFLSILREPSYISKMSLIRKEN
jgi:hypothetical protein